jgi:F0F1-type ATP synthase gamma subunit
VNASLDQKKSDADELVVLGERGARYMEDMKRSFTFFPGISDECGYKEAQNLAAFLLKGYKKKFGRIIAVYPKFISITVQKVTTEELLPYSRRHEGSVKYPKWVMDEMMIEPGINEAVSSLAEAWLSYMFLYIFWLSKQSEFGARIMHLEGSTQELSYMKQKLSFEYFRQVHALRDKTIREISAAKIMMGKKKEN